MVNANLSEFERLIDANHQYSDNYCVKCGHYPEVSMMREVDCECDCHCTDEVIAEMMECKCKCHG